VRATTPTSRFRLPSVAVAAAAAVFIALLGGGGSSHAATFTVTNNSDGGAGSLRDAITLANGNAGLDVINIDPKLGDISPATALPASTDPAGVTIKGLGFGVVIDGSALGASENGLHFHASAGVALTNVTVVNLTVRNFPGDGIKVCGGDPAFCDDELTDTLIDSVVSTNSGRGISLDGAPHLRSTVVDSVASENINRGVIFNAGASTLLTDATVQDTTANNNGSRGIELNSSGTNFGSTVTSSTANNNNSHGIHINAGDQLWGSTVVDSSVAGNTSHGVHLNSGDENFDSTVSRVIATANGADGIRVNANIGFTGTGAKITNNTALNNSDDGISTDVEGEITENTSTGNVGSGIHIERPAKVHFNRIVSNGSGFENTGAASNAENNWWGCNEGPNTVDCDTAVGSVDVSPWLVLEFAASPNSIPEGGSSTLTGNVTMNSNGIDTAASGSIPDGTDVEFATDFGSVGSSSTHKVTVGGTAQAVLTADSGPGIANVSAELDNETMGGAVTVTSAVQRTWGDVDCDGTVGTRDSQALLRNVLEQPALSQEGDCPLIGAPDGDDGLSGDLDCDGTVGTRDSQAILRYVLEQPALSQTQPCPLIGSPT